MSVLSADMCEGEFLFHCSHFFNIDLYFRGILMYCKNCFKKISSRSRFCKYCGASVQPGKKEKDEGKENAFLQAPPDLEESPADSGRPDLLKEERPAEKVLVSESQTEPAKETKKEYSFKLRSEREKEFPIPPKVIGIVIGIILIFLVLFVLMRSSIFQSEDSINYNDYIGVWQERGVEDVETSGGVRLEILSVDGSTMVISMGFYDGGAAYNSIRVENIGATLKEGSAYYTFSNDGYGNSGNGVLTFNNRSIQWRSVINKNEAKNYEVFKVANSVPEETEPSQESETTEATSESKTDNDYVLPDSSTKYLTEEDLQGLTAEELRIARNEIMARHGRQFNDPALAAYFESKDWYNGTVDPETFDSQVGEILNEYEMQNVELIQSME